MPEQELDPTPISTTGPPPRRSMGLVWGLFALGILAYFIWFQPQPVEEAPNPEWIQTQRAFLDDFSSQEGVILKQSGLMIRHKTVGDGPTPGPQSMVTVHYEGRLVNGEVFDSSRQRQQSATFPVNGVIPGWREALQLMQQGGSAEVVIPAELAYGGHTMGNGAIPAHSALVFDVELLEVE